MVKLNFLSFPTNAKEQIDLPAGLLNSGRVLSEECLETEFHIDASRTHSFSKAKKLLTLPKSAQLTRDNLSDSLREILIDKCRFTISAKQI
ncbi:hypothetical protein J6590_029013 [Homalodisca vitripennis]|nr:hypothetical protein J6590_029013 [Homalodisca vitripennis]